MPSHDLEKAAVMWSPVERAANKTLISGLILGFLLSLLSRPDWSGLWPLWIVILILGLAFLRSFVELVSEHIKWVRFRRFRNEATAPPPARSHPWDGAEKPHERDPGW
jgi:hypothetical protein